MAYTIELSPDEERVVQRRAARLGLTPQEYVRRSFGRHLRINRVPSISLTEEEKQAIALLNSRLPSLFWQRYGELTQKIRQRTITEEEHTEIKDLAAKEEAWNVERLQILQEMAQKRNIPLLELMKRNGIGPHPEAGHLLTEK